MSHFSCFFFRKRRNKRNQTEREKRRKATAVSLGVLEKRLFRIKCSDRFSSLRRDCGTNPVRKSDSTGFAGLLRWWAVVVCSLTAVKMAVALVGGGRARACSYMVAPTLLSLVRQVDGTDSAAVRFAAVSIVRLQKRRCSADVFPVLRNNPSVENPFI